MAKNAAPPNSAAAPIAPVCIAAPALELLDFPPAPAVEAAEPPAAITEVYEIATWLVEVTKSTMVVVGVGTPLVKGTAVPELAPE